MSGLVRDNLFGTMAGKHLSGFQQYFFSEHCKDEYISRRRNV